MLAIPVSAASSASASASKSTPYRGDTITVTVNVSGVGSCNAGSAEVKHGSGLEWTGAKSDIDGITVDYKLDQGKLIFYTMNGDNVNGKLLILTFKVKSDAAFASNEIQVSMQLNGETVKASTNITVSCNHKYSSWSNAGASGHSHKCSICGKTESASHTYDHGCDTSCNGCGATRSTSHTFGEEWISDETGHWHACTTCGEKADVAEHIPGEPAGEYTDQVCTECNYVLAVALGHQHKYDKTYLTDANSHWQKCLGCNEPTEAEPHIYDSDCDTTCDICAYERAVLHKEGDKWHNSTQEHWKVCEDCKARLYQTKHIWNSGTVLQEAGYDQPGKIEYFCETCKATHVEEIPGLTLFQAMPWWAWMLIGAVGGIILTVVAGLAIILPKILRKSKGRFAH
jgi:hypothetical protein